MQNADKDLLNQQLVQLITCISLLNALTMAKWLSREAYQPSGWLGAERFLGGVFTSWSVYKGELGKSSTAFSVFHMVLSALVAC